MNNPYLTLTGLCQAGIDGVITQRTVQAPVEQNLYTMSAAQREKKRIGSLASNLQEALHAFTQSNWIKQVYGDIIVHQLSLLKQQEIDTYNKCITTWERETYL
jgi:glutamine synthetase